MVLTPWGKSEELRDRKLRPGPGVPRDDVIANQKERLFGAMVAAVDQKGYAATTVADLVAISGVSSRTFYDLFADKQACFLATMEAVIGAAIAYATRRAGGTAEDSGEAGARPAAEAPPAGAWEERARAGLVAFARMVAAQPATAKLVMVEAYAAGPEALVPLENAVAGFEWLTEQVIAQSPERVGMPKELTMALMGAQQEMVRNRLREGREQELAEDSEELWGIILSYRPPPEPLRLSSRPPRAAPETIDAHDHAERAIRALAAVVAEKGYAATTVDEVVSRAQMSASTFYAHFDGKEDAMLAAIDSAGAQIVAATTPAHRRAPDWSNGIRAALGALFNFLAAHPALANLMMVEAYAAGPEAMARRGEALRPFEALIAGGPKVSPETSRLAIDGIAGAIYQLSYRRLRESGADALPALAPVCTYIALCPFIGPEEACRIANGDGRGRAPEVPIRP
ncbi:MAG TPA: helix-turn-helix domain-containing protein [Solirubrobacterales bacterium]|nr:helix-turn-helix domain-containing protein [Solirubrobacterales bacterium]